MASEERQKVRFTGKRTGMEAIRIKGFGLVQQGDIIEVSAETAERYTAPQPTGDGKEASDFSKVGGSYKRDEEAVAATEGKQREKAAAAEEAPEVEEAHESNPQGGTAEEEAEVLATVADEDEKKKK